jgi:hypothetical protein
LENHQAPELGRGSKADGDLAYNREQAQVELVG